MSTSTSVYLRFQFGFWCLLLPALHLPRWLTMELVTEYLVRDQALMLAFCAMGMAVSHACHLRLLGAQPERRVPWWRWPLAWALLTVGLLLPGAVTQFYNVGPLHVPGVGSTQAVLLFLVVRSSNASVVALGWAMGYAGIFAILRAHAAERARLQAQLALERQAALAGEARMAALQARIHPHFLFNALNCIRALIVENPEAARGAVTDLSYLMRTALNAADIGEHALSEELRIVDSYLGLEQLRFAERLRWRAEVDPAAADIVLPPLLLQTLVENGVKHGVGRSATPVQIVARIAREADGQVCVEVGNSGRLQAGEDSAGGSGLALSRERLQLRYGADAGLVLEERDGWVYARAVWRPRDATAAGAIDAGAIDAGAIDADVLDVGDSDAGLIDTSPTHASAPHASAPHASEVDAVPTRRADARGAGVRA